MGCDLTARSNNSIPSLGISARMMVNLDDLQGGVAGRDDLRVERGAVLADTIAAALVVGEDMLNWLGLIHLQI